MVFSDVKYYRMVCRLRSSYFVAGIVGLLLLLLLVVVLFAFVFCVFLLAGLFVRSFVRLFVVVAVGFYYYIIIILSRTGLRWKNTHKYDFCKKITRTVILPSTVCIYCLLCLHM